VRFWAATKPPRAPQTADANANFVEIVLDSRRTNYALTPIVGAMYGDISAKAVAA
jgi:hypothetical protein